MQGSITSKDVLLHAFTIVRLFGPSFYLRCVKAIASGREVDRGEANGRSSDLIQPPRRRLAACAGVSR